MNTLLKNGNQSNVLVNAFTTQTNVRRWGNSQGIRLSKEILNQLNLNENDPIEIHVFNDEMTIKKVKKTKHITLKERLESFYNKPIDEIYVESTHEIDTGDPVGSETW